jgi:phosphoglycolate phosphatase
MIDAVIFDLDGTLADTLPDIAAAMNAALQQFNLPTHPTEAYRHMVGEGAEVLAQLALGTQQQPSAAQLVEAYRTHYACVEHRFSRPYPGINDLLDALNQQCVPVAILSNKRHDFTQATVAYHFGGRPFVAVWGERQGEGVPRKPDPTAAIQLALHFNSLPSRIGFVGDTAIDMQTAKAAGMVPIGATWGFRPEELTANGAQHLLKTPLELLCLLRR